MTRKTITALSLITILSGCAVNNVNTLPGPPVQAVPYAPGVTPQDRILHSYMVQVNQIIAGQVGRLRAEQERAAIKQTGHPVPLPTGSCRAVAVILANGTVMRAELAGCTSRSLGKIELAAIHAASPLPPTPFGHDASITIQTIATDATPGVGTQ